MTALVDEAPARANVRRAAVPEIDLVQDVHEFLLDEPQMLDHDNAEIVDAQLMLSEKQLRDELLGGPGVWIGASIIDAVLSMVKQDLPEGVFVEDSIYSAWAFADPKRSATRGALHAERYGNFVCIIFAVFIGGNHWVVFEALPAQRIRVYDSVANSWRQHKQLLHSFQMYIAAATGSRPGEWHFEACPCPQQTTDDCGLFMLCNIRALVAGLDVFCASGPGQQHGRRRVMDLRRRIAQEIQNHQLDPWV